MHTCGLLVYVYDGKTKEGTDQILGTGGRGGYRLVQYRNSSTLFTDF